MFIPSIRPCQTANASPLNIIGQIELEVRIKHINTTVLVDVATNLVTPIILVGDENGQLTVIPYDEPPHINYPAHLINQITILPHSQMLVDVNSRIFDEKDALFEPYGRHISKLIFTPHALLDITENKTKVLFINAQNRQQTLWKHTRIGTIFRNSTMAIHTR